MSQRIFSTDPLSGGSHTHPQQQSAANATDASPESATGPHEDLKNRIPLIWIPVVICLGLVVAAGYLGARIIAGRPHESRTMSAAPVPAKPSQPQAAQTPTSEITAVAPAVDNAAPSETAPEVLTVRTQEDPNMVPPDDLSLIHPQPGERYIQLSALNTSAAHRYVDKLRNGPLEPHLAQGPTPTILRVLIGPFASRTSLMDSMTEFKAAGIECFIREY